MPRAPEVAAASQDGADGGEEGRREGERGDRGAGDERGAGEAGGAPVGARARVPKLRLVGEQRGGPRVERTGGEAAGAVGLGEGGRDAGYRSKAPTDDSSPRTPSPSSPSSPSSPRREALVAQPWLRRVKSFSVGIHRSPSEAAAYVGAAPNLDAVLFIADYSMQAAAAAGASSGRVTTGPRSFLRAASHAGGVVLGSPFSPRSRRRTPLPLVPPGSAGPTPTQRVKSVACPGSEASLRRKAKSACSTEAQVVRDGACKGGPELDSGGEEQGDRSTCSEVPSQGRNRRGGRCSDHQPWSPRKMVADLTERLRLPDNRESELVVVFEIPLDSIVGLDYTNPLCLDGRLTVEARRIEQRRYASAADMLEDYRRRAHDSFAQKSSKTASWSELLARRVSPARRQSGTSSTPNATSDPAVIRSATVVAFFTNEQANIVDVLEPMVRGDRRLLRLYETGVPIWAILAGSYGLPYRPWLRTFLRRAVMLLSLLSLLLGLADLHAHLPSAREWVHGTVADLKSDLSEFSATGLFWSCVLWVPSLRQGLRELSTFPMVYKQVWRGFLAIKRSAALVVQLAVAHRISLVADLIRLWEDMRQAGVHKWRVFHLRAMDRYTGMRGQRAKAE